mgnify:CR=1 FL=1
MKTRYQIDNLPQPIMTGGTETERILQNCKNMLMTKLGEVPYCRSVGFDVRLLDLPVSQLQHELCRELDRMLMAEPRAELVTADCRLNRSGEVYITMTIEVEEVD